MKKLLSLLPLALVLYFLNVRYEALQTASRIVSDIESQQRVVARVAAQKEQILSYLQGSHPDYLRMGSEAFSFAQPQVRRLQIGGMHQELDLLRSNRLQWGQESEHSTFGFKETNFKLAHPVFMNGDDLKKFLVFIEGVSIDPYIAKEKRPQLVIRDFELTRKMIGGEEVYAIDLHLTQRTK